VSLAVLLAGAACGGDDDDDAGDTPDASTDDGADDDGPDAGDDDGPDAGDGVGARFEDAEGGKVINEYINYGDTLAEASGFPKGVRTVYRGMAHFVRSMNPQRLDLPMSGVCTNVVTEELTWLGNMGEDVEYIDVGTVSIRQTNDDGDEVTTELARAEKGAPATWPRDNLFVDHGKDGIFYETISFGEGGTGAGEILSAGTRGDVILSGSDEFPATTYEGAVYVPENNALENPGLNEEFTMVAGEDFTVGWQEIAQPNAPAAGELTYELFELVATVNPATGAPIHLCPTVDQNANGEFVIPGEIIADYRETVTALGNDPNAIVLLRNTNAHAVVRLDPTDEDNKRRVDVVSVWCYVQLGATAAE
jgi:hypothetical protein